MALKPAGAAGGGGDFEDFFSQQGYGDGVHVEFGDGVFSEFFERLFGNGGPKPAPVRCVAETTRPPWSCRSRRPWPAGGGG